MNYVSEITITKNQITNNVTKERFNKPNSNYFIPEVVIINDILVPSTPFNFNDGKPLFMGDVIEVTFDDEGEVCFGIYVVDMVGGEYVSLGRQAFFDAPLSIYDDMKVRVLGNSVRNPELLKLLS